MSLDSRCTGRTARPLCRILERIAQRGSQLSDVPLGQFAAHASHIQYCTGFLIYKISTYCTVLLRIPKGFIFQSVTVRFVIGPRFGIRRRLRERGLYLPSALPVGSTGRQESLRPWRFR